MPLSAQLRGQPRRRTDLVRCVHAHKSALQVLPIWVLSCVPKRHHSLPTQVFTVRSALA